MTASTISSARLRRAAATIGVVSLLALAGCSTDDAKDEATTTPTGATGAAFPVTIESALGDVTIDEAPERVVALGWGSADIAVALGVVPVGIEADTWSGDDEGYQPWFREAVEATGAELPTTITTAPELDIEAIVALEPDLILAPQSGMDQATYDQLSEFTEVVAYPEGPWITPLDEQITIAAKALGKPEQAQPIMDAMDATLAEAAAQNPDFAGKTIAYVAALQPGTLSVYVPGDPRIDTLLGLGFVLAPSVADLTPPEGQFAVDFGLENADKLSDVQVLFTWFNSTEEQAVSEAQPLFAGIPAFASGAYVPMIDRQLGMAVTVSTPLSLPWAIDRYVPMIAEAVAKVG